MICNLCQTQILQIQEDSEILNYNNETVLLAETVRNTTQDENYGSTINSQFGRVFFKGVLCKSCGNHVGLSLMPNKLEQAQFECDVAPELAEYSISLQLMENQNLERFRWLKAKNQILLLNIPLSIDKAASVDSEFSCNIPHSREPEYLQGPYLLELHSLALIDTR